MQRKTWYSILRVDAMPLCLKKLLLNIFFTRKFELRCWQKLIKATHRDVTTRKTGEKCKYKKFKLAKNNCMRLQKDSFSIMTSEDALYWENHRERYFTLIFWPRNRMFLISSRFYLMYMTKCVFDLKDVQ